MTGKSSEAVRLGGDHGDLLLSIVYSLYRTIREEDRWPSILQQIQELLSAQTCSLSLHDFRSRTGSIAIHSGCFDEHHLGLYNETYSAHDPWLSREEHYRNVGASWVGDELVPQAQVVTTEFYREWLRPQGLMHQCSGILFREKDNLIHLTSYRSARSEPFSRSTLYPLQRLLPHVRQTLELQEMFAGSGTQASPSLGEMVRRLGSTTLILDAEKRLLAASTLGDEMLESGSLIRLDQGRVEAGTDELTEKLRILLDEALRTADGSGLSAGGTVEIPDGESGSATINVAPLPPESIPGQTQPAVYVTVNDKPLPDKTASRPRRWLPLVLRTPEEELLASPEIEARAAQAGTSSGAAEPNDERLRRLYNLTRSEARLAELLASGFGLPNAARRLGVGLNTVRTHLQRIYSKTDTHHQSELVALLLAGPDRIQVEYHRAHAQDGWDDADEGHGQLAINGSPAEARPRMLPAPAGPALTNSSQKAEKPPRGR